MLASSLAAIIPHAQAKNGNGSSKKQRSSVAPRGASGAPAAGDSPKPPPKKIDITKFAKVQASTPLKAAVTTKPAASPLADWLSRTQPPTTPPPPAAMGFKLERDAWKRDIVTTTFWIGEDAAKNNPVPNHASSWDQNWAKNYGGTDTPVRSERANYAPVNFVPQQNPFYVALPYNDITLTGHKPEASIVIPWFKEAYKGPHTSVLKGRWLAIRYKDRVAYAQWEDCGPFRTDHYEYVFGNERPRPNLNKGAGLDVSPAVRDYLGMADSDVTDWRFVEFADVPEGPWANHGENNPFVLRKRAAEKQLVLDEHIKPAGG